MRISFFLSVTCHDCTGSYVVSGILLRSPSFSLFSALFGVLTLLWNSMLLFMHAGSAVQFYFIFFLPKTEGWRAVLLKFVLGGV